MDNYFYSEQLWVCFLICEMDIIVSTWLNCET